MTSQMDQRTYAIGVSVSASFQPRRFVAPDELERAEQQGGADHNPGNPDPRWDGVRLGEGDAERARSRRR